MLIITGSIAYDYILGFPGIFGDHIMPNQIHNLNISFIVDKFAKHRGGTAGNVSWTLGLLGIPHSLFTTAGNDFGEYQKELLRIGVDPKHVVIDSKHNTAIGFALSDRGNNQIWAYHYGAAEGNKELKLVKVAKAGDLVLIGPQGAAGSLSMIRQCIDLKLDYMFDPGFILSEIRNEELVMGLLHAKYVIGNDYEVQLMKKRIKTFTKLMQSRVLITTLGEKGATIESGGTSVMIKPAKIDQIISTTGAGDAWRGGFLAGLHKQFNLKVCGQMGAVTASYALGSLGTQDYSFTKKEFVKRYQKTFRNELKL